MLYNNESDFITDFLSIFRPDESELVETQRLVSVIADMKEQLTKSNTKQDRLQELVRKANERIMDQKDQLKKLESERREWEEKEVSLQKETHILQSTLAESEQQLVSLQTEFTNYIAVTKENQHAQENASKAELQQLTKKETELKEKESAIGQKETELKEKESAIGQKETELKEKESAIGQKETELKEKESAIGQKETELKEKESAIGQKETELKEKESAIGQKETELKEKESAIGQKETELKEKESAIGQKETELKEKESAIGQKETELKEKESAIGQKETEWNQKELTRDQHDEDPDTLKINADQLRDRAALLDRREDTITQQEQTHLTKEAALQVEADALQQRQEMLRLKEEQLDELQVKLKLERDTELTRLEDEHKVRCDKLRQEEESISNTKEVLTKMEELQNKRDKELKEKAEMLDEREEQSTQKETQLQRREDEIKEKEVDLARKGEFAVEKEKTLTKQEEGLVKREDELRNQEAAIIEKSEEVKKIREQVLKKEETLSERDSLLTRREEDLQNREASLLQIQEQSRTEKNTLISLSNQHENRLCMALEDLKHEIISKTEQISDLSEKIQKGNTKQDRLQELVRKANERIMDQKDQLKKLESERREWEEKEVSLQKETHVLQSTLADKDRTIESHLAVISRLENDEKARLLAEKQQSRTKRHHAQALEQYMSLVEARMDTWLSKRLRIIRHSDERAGNILTTQKQKVKWSRNAWKMIYRAKQIKLINKFAVDEHALWTNSWKVDANRTEEQNESLRTHVVWCTLAVTHTSTSQPDDLDASDSILERSLICLSEKELLVCLREIHRMKNGADPSPSVPNPDTDDPLDGNGWFFDEKDEDGDDFRISEKSQIIHNPILESRKNVLFGEVAEEDDEGITVLPVWHTTQNTQHSSPLPEGSDITSDIDDATRELVNSLRTVPVLQLFYNGMLNDLQAQMIDQEKEWRGLVDQLRRELESKVSVNSDTSQHSPNTSSDKIQQKAVKDHHTKTVGENDPSTLHGQLNLTKELIEKEKSEGKPSLNSGNELLTECQKEYGLICLSLDQAERRINKSIEELEVALASLTPEGAPDQTHTDSSLTSTTMSSVSSLPAIDDRYASFSSLSSFKSVSSGESEMRSYVCTLIRLLNSLLDSIRMAKSHADHLHFSLLGEYILCEAVLDESRIDVCLPNMTARSVWGMVRSVSLQKEMTEKKVRDETRKREEDDRKWRAETERIEEGWRQVVHEKEQVIEELRRRVSRTHGSAEQVHDGWHNTGASNEGFLHSSTSFLSSSPSSPFLTTPSPSPISTTSVDSQNPTDIATIRPVIIKVLEDDDNVAPHMRKVLAKMLQFTDDELKRINAAQTKKKRFLFF
ncbi:hypothetical protein BLNAU_3711 [Blattamonas nauphoetae]|uniref:GRIP domain-containing protein n=1 Tax=Blattamonas nauphoetae TaxID=2049346 RepID=A0ABQ9YC42_9EUKA|nr:hypothetical protein BLNAU_3711 [Blattamonas nauphoetae]